MTLEDRIAELEERVAWLESELGLVRAIEQEDAVRKALHLVPAAMKCLSILYAAKGRVVLDGSIEDRLNPERDYASNIANIYTTRIRRALGKDSVERVRTQGFRLTRVGMERVRRIVEETAPNRAPPLQIPSRRSCEEPPPFCL